MHGSALTNQYYYHSKSYASTLNYETSSIGVGAYYWQRRIQKLILWRDYNNSVKINSN